jgi:two-component system nitrate/nitrite response regulator NarP
MPRPFSVVIIEDDPVVRSHIVSTIESDSSLRLAAAFEAGEPALDAFSKGAKADVALVDLGLPGMQGHDLIRMLRERSSRCWS